MGSYSYVVLAQRGVERGLKIGGFVSCAYDQRARRRVRAGVVVTATTPIVDVRGEASVRTKGRIPARAIVIPGMLPKQFPAGAYATACALIVGTRNESTDLKTSLNAALREHDVAV